MQQQSVSLQQLLICPGGRVTRRAPSATQWQRRPQRQQRGGGRAAAAGRQTQEDSSKQSEAAETTEKFGLEAGLWKVWSDKSSNGESKGQQAKELLKRYGSAYLLTSISFALVSFAACYLAVSAGVDVAALLARLGLQASDTSEKVGTLALAYAAHKALSPVRFPPTVALTPVVARWLGRGGGGGEGGEPSDGS